MTASSIGGVLDAVLATTRPAAPAPSRAEVVKKHKLTPWMVDSIVCIRLGYWETVDWRTINALERRGLVKVRRTRRGFRVCEGVTPTGREVSLILDEYLDFT